MIVLDTNVISETIRARPSPNVLAWLNEVDPTSLYLTAITVQELTFGVECLDDGRRKAGLRTALELILAEDFRGRILAYDDHAAHHYGRAMAKARRRGIGIGVADGQIAAIALAHDVPVATHDHTPFEALGVGVIDPWR